MRTLSVSSFAYGGFLGLVGGADVWTLDTNVDNSLGEDRHRVGG